MASLFADRADAGKRLAKVLAEYVRGKDAMVLALPRGGVPVAYEIARALSLPLDVWLVRKLGAPGQEELAMGAIALGGALFLNQDIIQRLQIPPLAVERTIEKEKLELERRDTLYRQGRPPPAVEGKTVIVVDDGLATGATMLAAVASLREAQAGRVVVAVPIAAGESCQAVEKAADMVVCLATPSPFYGVGEWYGDFSQTEDAEVRQLLAAAL